MFSGKCCCSEQPPADELVFSGTDEKGTLPNLLPHAAKDIGKQQIEFALATPTEGKNADYPLGTDSSPSHATVLDREVIAENVETELAVTTSPEMPVNVKTETDPRVAKQGELDQRTEINLEASEDTTRPSPAEPGDDIITEAEEVRSEDVQKLQASVTEFAQRAVLGCACEYVNVKTGKRTPAIYKISRDLTQFSIVSEKVGVVSRFTLTCSLGEIEDIDEFDGCEELLKSKAMTSLAEGDKDRLLMVFYRDKRNAINNFCLLEKDRKARDSFSTGVRTLATSLRE